MGYILKQNTGGLDVEVRSESFIISSPLPFYEYSMDKAWIEFDLSDLLKLKACLSQVEEYLKEKNNVC